MGDLLYKKSFDQKNLANLFLPNYLLILSVYIIKN